MNFFLPGTFTLESQASYPDQLSSKPHPPNTITIPDNQTIEVLEGLKVEVIDNSSSTINFILHKDVNFTYRMKIHPNSNTNLDRSLVFTLAGSGARANIKFVCEGKNDGVCKIKTFQHHKVSDTYSDLLIKGVLHDSFRLFCNNLIRVEPGAQRVVANEQNKNLLLSDDAKVITIPKLEVEADDVSCRHGAAISRFNEDEIFYFQSRGINPDQAKQTLINAFLNQ